MRQAKAPADNPAIAKYLLDLFRTGVSRDVEIFGFPPQQQISDTATNQIGLVIGFFQALQYFQGIFTDLRTGNAMLWTRINLHGTRPRRLIDRFGNLLNRWKDFFEETKNDFIPYFRMTCARFFEASGANVLAGLS